jgi:hypothetical protein
MALIIDPDDLSQGTEYVVANFVITTPGTGADSQFTGTSMGSLIAGDFFEIRDHTDPLANGLWQVVTVNTDTSDYEVDKISNGAVPATAASESVSWLGGDAAVTDEKSVYIDTLTEEIWLLEQGNLSVDGVTMLALHSFLKKRWKDDQLLIDSGAFPMVGISFAAGQWEFGEDPSGNNSDWKLKVDAPSSTDSVRLIRNAGWDEKNNAGVVQKKFFNVTTLGIFEDTADQALYYFGNDYTLDNTVSFAFTGPVNEPVQYYENIGDLSGDTPAFATTTTITRTTGSFITDGFVVGGQIEISNSTSNDGVYELSIVSATSMTITTTWTAEAWGTTTIAYDQSNAVSVQLRIRDGDAKGKTFQTSGLAEAGETAIASKVIKFPLANAADQKIDASDAQVVTGDWAEVRIRYLDQTYNREVDSGTKRDFGIVIDAGTYSQANGAAATTSRWDSANINLGAGEALADYAGGTLIVHEGANQGSYTISGTPVDSAGTLQVTVVGTPLTVSGSDESFTVQRATPLGVSAQNIFERVQYELRQATDINSSADGAVIGLMTGELAAYVGNNITFGGAESINPNGTDTGVIVEGFDANDTNNMFFVDNLGAATGTRNFPFVAAGNLNFNSNLTADSDPEYWLYFQYTERVTNATIDCIGNAGSTYDLESDAAVLPVFAVDDYVRISGFAQDENNGLFRVTVVNTSQSDYTVIRVDGEAVGTTETNQTVSVDKHPYNSPDAIIVDDNSTADIVGAASASQVAFDFDYDNNVQGGRTAATDAVCVLKAVGLETGQYVEVTGLTITRSVGLSFTATAPLERNFTP